jgi:hypothetical protein
LKAQSKGKRHALLRLAHQSRSLMSTLKARCSTDSVIGFPWPQCAQALLRGRCELSGPGSSSAAQANLAREVRCVGGPWWRGIAPALSVRGARASGSASWHQHDASDAASGAHLGLRCGPGPGQPAAIGPSFRVLGIAAVSLSAWHGASAKHTGRLQVACTLGSSHTLAGGCSALFSRIQPAATVSGAAIRRASGRVQTDDGW